MEDSNKYFIDFVVCLVWRIFYDRGSPVIALIGQPTEVDTFSTPSYTEMTHDHLGSARGSWNTSKVQTANWEYGPYGTPLTFAGPSSVTQLYTGHDLDRASGNYYAPFRTLNPNTGRWLSRDPLGMIDGTNMYGYVGGNPINATDPLGLSDDILDVINSRMDRQDDGGGSVRAGGMLPLAPTIDPSGRGAVEAPAAFVDKLMPGDWFGECVSKREPGAAMLGALSQDAIISAVPFWRLGGVFGNPMKKFWAQAVQPGQNALLRELFHTGFRPAGLLDDTMRGYRTLAVNIIGENLGKANLIREHLERIEIINFWL